MRRWGLVAAGSFFLGAIGPAGAATDCAIAPQSLRFEDRSPCPHRLAGSPPVDLVLGGEIRQRYEYTHNPTFGDDPQDEAGVWLQRFTAHADLSIGRHVRVFAQLFSANEIGREGGPSPVDEDRLAVQNAFVDIRAPGLSSIRLGRQEIRFGSGRIVDFREGPNVRRTFDAARLFLETAIGTVEGFAARPVESLPGSFDNTPADSEGFWGASLALADGLLPAGRADVYLIRSRDAAATYVQGTGEERRTSFGLRLFGTRDAWDWNWEGLYQIGDFAGADIRAWTVATESGFTLQEAPWAPRLGLSANIASGDDDPGDGTLGTFNPLYPRGNYFSEAAVLGPRNFFNIRPSVSVSPLPGLSLGTDVNLFWRLEKADAVYGPPGQIVRAGGDGHYVGTAWSTHALYEVSARLSLGVVYTHFRPGRVIETTGAAETLDFVEASVQFRF